MPSELTTTAPDVFDTIGPFLKEQEISWGNVCFVFTDDAPAVPG